MLDDGKKSNIEEELSTVAIFEEDLSLGQPPVPTQSTQHSTQQETLTLLLDCDVGSAITPSKRPCAHNLQPPLV